MTAFSYEALDAGGKKKKGVLSADSLRLARRELQSVGLSPLKIEVMGQEKEKSVTSRKTISRAEVVAVTRQIATLLDASTPVEEALAAVAAQMNKPAVNRTLLAIRARVMEGWRLSDAMNEHPKAFNTLYTSIIAAGETSGDLGSVMSRLADMLEKNRTMVMKAITALIYPAVLAVVAMGVVVGLMVFVVPKIVEQFSNIGAELPLITRIVIGLSEIIQNWGLVILLVIILSIAAFWRALKLVNFRLAVDRMILKMPIVGNLARNLDAARFGRTLSTLFASGAPLLECLQAARKTVTNTHIKQQLGDTVISVQEGVSLSGGLRKSAALPAMMVYMIAAGERSGELPVMLDKTALHMEESFDSVTTLALRLLEPLIIVGMGLVVLCIVMAILVPILQLNTFAAG